ncbi:GNAT family N-acetyltransferase [Aerococcaceae bacterium DSM 111176]|nr:GNAT family N-acetyltransferase [Aerococcaceae bacterium DSM 111176]
MEIKTERLYIRPFIKKDIDDIYEIYKDKNVCKYLLHEAWENSDKEKEFDKKIQNNELSENSLLSLAVVLNDKVIGDISVWYTEMRETVEIGFVFNPKFSKKGYARESVYAVISKLFDNYKVHRIQANLDARNTPSAKLCENLGMRREAHFIKDYWNKGEWTDSFVYGMLITDKKKNK